MKVIVNVDFSSLQEIAGRGIRRTALFLGLGINAANNPVVKEYVLEKESPLHFLPENVDEKTLANFKNEFSRWIVACGFRELIETFTVFLDGVYGACLAISSNMSPVSISVFRTKTKKFRYAGIETKLSRLEEEFNVKIEKPDYLVLISKARNCLTHRLGIVGTEDCDDNGKLIVKWMGLEIYAENPSGETIPLDPMPDGGVILKAGGQIKAKHVERVHVLEKGNLIVFSPGELLQICFFVNNLTIEMTNSALSFVKNVQSQQP